MTARLSRRFYDAIGDDAANDLVNWMNAVDLTYRNELLQHNEANFTRFSATLDSRVASLRDDMDRRLGRIEARLDKIDIEALEARIDAMFARFEARILRWMLVFWTTSMLAFAATIAAILQAR